MPEKRGQLPPSSLKAMSVGACPESQKLNGPNGRWCQKIRRKPNESIHSHTHLIYIDEYICT